MVREVALHLATATEKAIDLDTLDKTAVQRVPVPDNLEKGFTVWLLDTLSVEYVVKEVFVEGLGVWWPLSGVEAIRKASVVWPEVVHVLISDEPGCLPREKQSTGPHDLAPRERAFKLEYQNPDNVSTMHQALTCIMQRFGYAPSAGIFQSSGWGKSRLVCELWRKDVWVVYFSFAAQGGYPKTTPIACWFHQQAMRLLGSDESLKGQLACMNFTLAYFTACMLVLGEGLENSVWNCESFVIETREGNNYWKAVQRKTMEILGELTQIVGLTAIQESKQFTWAMWEDQAAQAFKAFWPNNRKRNAQKLEYLFVFDEARHLVRNASQLNCFLPVRRATRAVSRCGIVVLFVDTSSEISNFSAPDWADPSDRIAAGNVMLAPPIWGTFSADISENDSLQLFSSKTLNSIASRVGSVRYGRPLWWATFKSYLPKLREGEKYTETVKLDAFQSTYSLAQDKLLGGAGKWLEYIINKKSLPEEAALSLLGATIGLDVDPHSKLASKLVASHLLSVLSVSPSRELVWTVWSSEPLVSRAAAEAIRLLNGSGRSRELYSSLMNALAAGWIDRGFTGELVAKIILLDAKMKGEESQSGLCTVDNFCKHLVGKSLSELITRPMTVNEKKLAKAQLHFNSFRRIHKKLSDMTFDDFLNCAERGCAVQCVAGTWGVDLIIFAFIGNDDDELTLKNTTVIYVQVKLREKDNAAIVTVAKASPQYTGLSIASEMPYMSLYMNVFDKGEKACANWVDATLISAAVEASASKPIQAALKEIREDQQPDADFMEIEGADLGKKGRAVQAWKAWFKARGEDLQTVLVVKGLEAFELDEGLKDQLKQVGKTSRSPFFSDSGNELHKELLDLQKSSLQQMFKIENFHNF